MEILELQKSPHNLSLNYHAWQHSAKVSDRKDEATWAASQPSFLPFIRGAATLPAGDSADGS